MLFAELSVYLPPEVLLEEAVDMLDLEGWKWLNLLETDSVNKTKISQLRAILGSKLAKLRGAEQGSVGNWGKVIWETEQLDLQPIVKIVNL